MPRKERHKDPRPQKTVTLILSAVIAIACGLRFLYSYKSVFDTSTNGGFYSPRDLVIFRYVLIALTAMLLSVLCKLLLRRRVTLWILLAVSVILPLLCWQINCHTFKKDGMLYFLVEEGGPLHFVTIRDFNLDGVDDSLDYTGEDVRTVTGSTLIETDPNGLVERMEYVIVGKGGKLDYAGCEPRFGRGELSLRLNRSRVTYGEIRITLYLTEAYAAKDLVLYQGGKRQEVMVIDGHTLSVTFDADTCAAWQQSATDESFRVIIRYEMEN